MKRSAATRSAAPARRPPSRPSPSYLNSFGEPYNQGTGPGLRLQGYSTDLSHQVFFSGAALLPECRTETTGSSVSFQWLRDGVPIAGATGPTYEIAPADEGAAIQCQAFVFGAGGGATQIANAPLIVPAGSATPPGAPASIAAPSGPALPVGDPGGQTLTCAPGSWKGAPTFTYQWYRDGVAIAGATASTYTVSAADLASAAAFQCAVTGTNAQGATVKASAAKTTTPAPAGPPPPERQHGQ